MEIAALGDAVDSNEGSGVSVNVDGSKTVVSAGVTKKEEVKKDEAKKDETKKDETKEEGTLEESVKRNEGATK